MRLRECFVLAILACLSLSNEGKSGSSGGVVSSKEKLMSGEPLSVEERSALLDYIDQLEKPVVVGTSSDTILIRRGQAWKIGEPRIEENQVLTGEAALEALKIEQTK